MKKWLIIIIILVVLSILYKKKEYDKTVNLTTYTAIDSLEIKNNPWELLFNIEPEDTNNVYKVVWDQKYGSTKVQYCMAIFKNDSTKQYKLIAPWLNTVIIEKQNINDINFSKIDKKEINECTKK